jgi:hypothetical protein
MRLMNYIIELSIFSGLGGDSYNAFEILLSDLDRRKEEHYYATIIKNNFPRGNPCPHSDLTKYYLSRQYQDRHNYSRPTKMPFNGLQKRANREFRESEIVAKVREEQKIKEAFRVDSRRNKEYKQDLKGTTKETRRQLRKSRYRK